MKKIQKIVEARAVVKGNIHTINNSLSKLLTVSELKTLEPELGLLIQACKLLEIKILDLDPTLKQKARNLL